MKQIKIVVAILFIAIALFGLIQTKEQKPSASNVGDSSSDSSKIIANALILKGIIVENVLITNGSEIIKAFDAYDIGIPSDSKVAFVTFKVIYYGNKSDSLPEHVKTMYTALDADKTIDGVLIWDSTFAKYSGTALILYVDRSKAESVRNLNLTDEDLISNFPLIEYTSYSNSTTNQT